MNHSIGLRTLVSLLIAQLMFLLPSFSQDLLLSNSHIDSTENLIRIEVSDPQWNEDSVLIRISKATLSGTLLWEHFLVAGSGSRVLDLTSDSQSRIYLAAVLKDQLSIGGAPFKDFKPGPSSVLMILDGEGQFLKLMTWSYVSQFRITDVQTSAMGEVWVSGNKPIKLHSESSSLNSAALWFNLDATGAMNRVLTLQQTTTKALATLPDPREFLIQEWVFPGAMSTKNSAVDLKALQSTVFTDPIEPPTTEPPEPPTGQDTTPPP